MTKIGLIECERWPTYSITEDSYYPSVEVDDETLARWRAVTEAFDQVQSEMSELFTAAEARQKREREVAAAEKAVREAQAKLDAPARRPMT